MMTSKINHELHYQHIKEPRKVHLAVRLRIFRLAAGNQQVT
jgi:hypothetical protein